MTTDENSPLIAKPIREWMKQLSQSRLTIRQKNGGSFPPTMLHAFQVDAIAYSQMIEAMVALGPPYIDQEVPSGLISLAAPFLTTPEAPS